MEENLRSVDAHAFSIHDISDGRIPPVEEHEANYDPLAGPAWPENDGINILGTPYGSPKFIEDYLKKLVKNEQLLSFIKDVARMGFPRESHKMLTGSATPRLSHVLKSISKDQTSTSRMEEVDNAHL
jgi:hypothetical protein